MKCLQVGRVTMVIQELDLAVSQFSNEDIARLGEVQ